MDPLSASTVDFQWNDWSLQLGPDSGRLGRPGAGPLLSWNAGSLMLPVTGHGLARVGETRLEPDGPDQAVFSLRVDNTPDIGCLKLRVRRRPDHFEFQVSFVARRDGALFAWEPLPRGTRLDLYRAWHVRNRHHTPRVIERYNLGGHLTGGELGAGGKSGGIRLSTDSTDWQFAPHPSLHVFEKGDDFLFLGAKDLPQGFGFVIEAENHILTRGHLDYGHGIFQYRAGEEIFSPVFSLFVRGDGDYWAVIDQWVDALVSEGRIPDPARRVFDETARKPFLGPWIDQCYIGRTTKGSGMVWNWGGDNASDVSSILSVCCDGFIRAEVEKAERLGLPFGTIGIDDRWFRWRGDYELNQDKFPDMRALVDWIHGKGLKVLLWWPPFDVEPKAAMNHKREWLAGGGALTRHGQPFLDYSHPEVREKWLLPKLRLWLGDGPGCWNADGFKLDFLADKVPANIPVFDREWQGEERFIHHWHRCVREAMHAIKPGTLLLGCSPHPHLAAHQDWIRTFDIHDSDYRQHGSRGLRIRHFAPGVLLSFDFHAKRENFAAWLQLANAEHAHLEIGSLIGFSDGAVTEDDFRLMRQALAENQARPGLRHSPANEEKLKAWALL